MTKKERILNICLSISLILIAVMTILPLMHIVWKPAPYIFAAGALGALVVRLFEKYVGDVLRLKRLHRMEKISAMCYVLSAFFMFYEQAQPTDWLGFLMAGAVIQVYTSFMIPFEEKKALRKQ